MEVDSLSSVKQIIRALIISSPEEITLDKLRRDFRRMEGKHIPFGRLGYDTLEELLHALSDTVEVFGRGPTAIIRVVKSQKSEHIQKMVKNQKKPAKHPNGRIKNVNPISEKLLVNDENIEGGQSKKQNKPAKHPNGRIKKVNPISEKPLVNDENIEGGQSKKQNKPAKHPNGRIKKVNPISEKPLVNDENIEGGQSMQPEENQELPFFKNVDLNCITRVLTMRNVPSLAKGQKTNEETKSGTYYNITEEIFEESGKLLDKRCQIGCKTANITHTNISAPKINPKAHALSTSNTVVGQQGLKPPRNHHQNNEHQITSNKPTSKLRPVTGAQETNCMMNDLNKAIPKCARNALFSCLDFPISSTQYVGQLPPNMTFQSVDVGTRLVIIITEIHSPYKFWFHIYEDTHYLDTLMDNMGEWYKKVNGNEMRVPIDHLKPGQLCAALFRNIWHRAMITRYPVKNKVTVSFVDYGTVYEVDADEIKYLTLDFCKLPAQALRGSLSYVKTRRSYWDSEANKYFASLVTETVIYAKISKINATQHVFYMVACCNHDDNVMQINSALIQKRYAWPDD
uniref:HTH OST-type domain-containing protein n=1 Tax=Glossina palpalis gambiensis TaxID=67801 RepID=A0A1B0BNU8_9MUSC